MWIPYVRNLAELTENERNLNENISKKNQAQNTDTRKQFYDPIGYDSN